MLRSHPEPTPHPRRCLWTPSIQISAVSVWRSGMVISSRRQGNSPGAATGSVLRATGSKSARKCTVLFADDLRRRKVERKMREKGQSRHCVQDELTTTRTSPSVSQTCNRQVGPIRPRRRHTSRLHRVCCPRSDQEPGSLERQHFGRPFLSRQARQKWWHRTRPCAPWQQPAGRRDHAQQDAGRILPNQLGKKSSRIRRSSRPGIVLNVGKNHRPPKPHRPADGRLPDREEPYQTNPRPRQTQPAACRRGRRRAPVLAHRR